MGIRTLAAILALGAFLWGLPCLLLLVSFGWGLVFLPGYVLLIFYVTRWMAVPPHWIRYAGWSLSLFVQGAWLAWFLRYLSIEGGPGPKAGDRVMVTILLTWWGGACLASVWALAWEHRVPTESDVPPIFRRPKAA